MNALITAMLGVATAALVYAAAGHAAVEVGSRDITLVPLGLSMLVGSTLLDRLR